MTSSTMHFDSPSLYLDPAIYLSENLMDKNSSAYSYFPHHVFFSTPANYRQAHCEELARFGNNPSLSQSSLQTAPLGYSSNNDHSWSGSDGQRYIAYSTVPMNNLNEMTLLQGLSHDTSLAWLENAPNNANFQYHGNHC